MEFETAFDLARSGYKYGWFPAAALLPLLAGAVMAFAPRLAPRLMGSHVKGRLVRFFGMIFFVFAACWAALAFMNTWNDYRHHRDVLASGEYRTVEGVVENFRPLAAHGRGIESFEVKGVRFQYSPLALSPGFNRAAAEGGPIANGVHVRIAYFGLAILRLEIGRR